MFATFLNLVFLKGVLDILLAKQAQWGQNDVALSITTTESERKEQS